MVVWHKVVVEEIGASLQEAVGVDLGDSVIGDGAASVLRDWTWDQEKSLSA